MALQQDEYGRPVAPTFRTPMDFVAYIDSLGPEATTGAKRQADEIRKNPNGWEMSGGHPKKKDDFLARHVPAIALGAVGGLAAGPIIGAIKGASSGLPSYMAAPGVPSFANAGTGMALPTAAGAGTLAASHLPVGDFMGGPADIASEGISRAYGAEDFLGAKPGPRGTPGGDGGGGAPKWLEPVVAALSGLPGLLANRGPSDEEKAQLEQLRQLQALQTQRIQYQSPLFEAVSKLAMSRLPGSVQSPMGEMK